MIDRALGFTAPESYYFQLYPVNLILLQEPKPTEQSKFKFSIYKGMQKFDENKIMTQSNFIDTNGTKIMPFRGCQLNFYLPNFNKARKILFTLKLTEKDATQEYELGGVDIDPANYIQEFKQKGQTRFQQKVQISEQYAIQFQMYLEKSRFALEKIVKSFKTQRSMKSPVRQRKSPVQQRKSPVQDKKSPIQEHEPEVVEEPPIVQKSGSKSRSKVVEPISSKKEEEQLHQEAATEEKPAQKSRSVKNNLSVEQKPAQKTKSQASESLVSPMVKSKQMKRTSGRGETSIRSSQRLIKATVQETTVTAIANQDNWTNHLLLVGFTLLGILVIYWVMHPTSKV